MASVPLPPRKSSAAALAETRAYTSRGWLGSILVKNGTPTLYSLSGPSSGLINYAGNGNVLGVIDSVNGTWTYGYDGVNRLNTAVATGHSFAYTDDRYGNMTCVDNGSVHSPCTPSGLAFNPANNRINSSGYSYDNNGNLLTNNALTRALVYDTENRIQCVQGTDGTCTSASATVYSYDPDGQRIAKATGAGTLIEEYVYDLKGDQASAHNSTGTLRNEVYDPSGRHDATYSSSGLTYNFADWLGTERVQFNSGCTGSFMDMPFGMDLAGTSCDTSPMHFTGKQKDTETGLDYFGARFNSSNLGRFMTPDWSAKAVPVPYAKVNNPQTLSLYVYVRNNPLSFVDADGHVVALTGTTDDIKTEKERVTANASKKGEAALFKTATDKNGKTSLVLDKAAAANFKGQHSAGYNLLNAAIDSKHIATVEMVNTDSRATLYANGDSTVHLDRNVAGIDNVAPFKDPSNPGKDQNPFSIIAGHELLGHALLNMFHQDGGDGPRAPVWDIEQTLRKEQGLMPRPDDAP